MTATLLRYLAYAAILAAGAYAATSIWDLAHWQEPWRQSGTILRRLERRVRRAFLL